MFKISKNYNKDTVLLRLIWQFKCPDRMPQPARWHLCRNMHFAKQWWIWWIIQHFYDNVDEELSDSRDIADCMRGNQIFRLMKYDWGNKKLYVHGVCIVLKWRAINFGKYERI